MRFRELKLRKDPDCPVCGTHPTVTKLIDYEQFCGIHPAAPEPATVMDNATEITAVELKQRLDRGDALKIVDVREPNEYQINRIPGLGADSARRRAAALRRARPETTRSSCSARWAARSAKAADFLRSVGVQAGANLKGGILDWIDKVDPEPAEILRAW